MTVGKLRQLLDDRIKIEVYNNEIVQYTLIATDPLPPEICTFEVLGIDINNEDTLIVYVKE